MLSNIRKVRIQWSDCDPAGIVFYPRYFEMFDISTTALIERALGMSKFDYLKAYNFLGHPLVASRARFLKPARFGDEVTIETSVIECGRTSFTVAHRLSRDGVLAAEGRETRVWAVRDPDDPARLRPRPIPAEIAARLTRS